MHHNHRYMIPKALRQVTLWVHPEGRVIGSLFLSFHTKNGPGLRILVPSSMRQRRFSCQRAEPEDSVSITKGPLSAWNTRRKRHRARRVRASRRYTVKCRSWMARSSQVLCAIHPPNHERLYDYLNLSKERFAKLYLEDGNVCLVNKAYIVCVASHGRG